MYNKLNWSKNTYPNYPYYNTGNKEMTHGIDFYFDSKDTFANPSIKGPQIPPAFISDYNKSSISIKNTKARQLSHTSMIVSDIKIMSIIFLYIYDVYINLNTTESIQKNETISVNTSSQGIYKVYFFSYRTYIDVSVLMTSVKTYDSATKTAITFMTIANSS